MLVTFYLLSKNYKKTTLWSFPDIEMKMDFDTVPVTWATFANSSNRLALTHENESALWDTATEKYLLKLNTAEWGTGYFFSCMFHTILAFLGGIVLL